LAQRPARIAGRERRVGQHCHEQPRQVFGVVDDLPQHLIAVHHRRRRVAQRALGHCGARELPHVQHHHQPGSPGLAHEVAQRGQHGARVGARDADGDVGGAQQGGRHLLAAQPLQHRPGHLAAVRLQP